MKATEKFALLLVPDDLLSFFFTRKLLLGVFVSHRVLENTFTHISLNNIDIKLLRRWGAYGFKYGRV
jgi:hypothetical protein